MTMKVKKQIEYTLNTMAIENLAPSDEAIALCEKVSDGSISVAAAVFAIKEKYGVKKNV